jgi:putative endopeptidase
MVRMAQDFERLDGTAPDGQLARWAVLPRDQSPAASRRRLFSADQRFFIAFARLWGVKMREEAMRLQINTNPHPVAQWRAIATLRNLPEFQRAFQCKPGDPMVRPATEQCKLW